MKIAFDLDGTCWEHRQFFIALIKGLITQGHEVGIITSHNEKSKEADLKLWKARGFPKVSFYKAKTSEEASIPAREWKPKVCVELKVDYLFDDFDTYNVVELHCFNTIYQRSKNKLYS